jgi:hypothetical protein
MESIKHIFECSWRIGIIIFTESKDPCILKDAFQTASNMCSTENAVIQMTLRANKIILDNIIKSNDPNTTKELEEIGNDLVKLIQISATHTQ